MTKIITWGISGIIFVLGFTSLFVFQSAPKVEIKIDEQGFSPESLTVATHTEIVFVNAGTEDHWPASDVHPTHEKYPELDPKGPIPPGGSWQFVPTKQGTWEIHDHLFPNLKATISIGEKDQTESAPDKTFVTLPEILKPPTGKQTAPPKVGHKKTSPLPPTYSKAELAIKFPFSCNSNDFTCAAKFAEDVTETFGPQAATDAILKAQTDNLLSRSVDDHQLAHRIGRKTARIFGINATSFLLCPQTTFNDGCQHGFFEYAIGQSGNSREAALDICSTVSKDAEFSEKFKFYCYHGAGHGIMMAQANDMRQSLSICDSLPEERATNGCYQGVFMENVNAVMRNEARSGIFSTDNPLLPCADLEIKYRHECFVNHAGYLAQFFRNDFGKAAAACLRAPKESLSSCLRGLGLMASNPAWQKNLLPVPVSSEINKRAAELCAVFPAGYESECVIGAVGNIMNFNEKNPEVAGHFCEIVPTELQTACATQIGADLHSQINNVSERKSKCESLSSSLVGHCLKGMGGY